MGVDENKQQSSKPLSQSSASWLDMSLWWPGLNFMGLLYSRLSSLLWQITQQKQRKKKGLTWAHGLRGMQPIVEGKVWNKVKVT